MDNLKKIDHTLMKLNNSITDLLLIHNVSVLIFTDWDLNDKELHNIFAKGACKYYISTLAGEGVSEGNAYFASLTK